MKYMIAVDSGGTKTESVLLDETGHILARDVTEGANGLAVGFEKSVETLGNACHRLAACLPEGERLSAIYGGVAGTADYFPGRLEKELYPILPQAEHIRFEGDGGCLIAAGLGHRDGVCLISGTGSSLFIRNGQQLKLIGGWSPWIDTEGSGYTMGREAILAAYRALDGRGPKTVLYDLIQEQMGQKPELMVPQIAAGGRPYIASFARTVFAGRKLGDPEATRIYDHAVLRLGELVWAGHRELGKPFQVVMGGGLFAAFPEFFESVKARCPETATPILLTQRPILGAAVEALFEAGVEDTQTFRDTFTREYQRIVSTNEKNAVL